jgi:hypothetical protein
MDPNAKSDDIDTHTKTSVIRLHTAETGADGKFIRPDQDMRMTGEPGHQALCDLEQAFMLRAIRVDLDLAQHMADGVNSLKIVLAAVRSAREGRAIDL